MKICFIALKAYPIFKPKIKSTFGGAEVQLYLLSKELAKNKELDIHFMVADYGQKNTEVFSKVKVWKALNFKNNKIKQTIDFFKIFNMVNADTYVQRTLTVQSGLIALYCKLRRKRFIYMVAHDSETDGTHEIFKKPFNRFLANLVYKFSYKIIVQNNIEKKDLAKYGYSDRVYILKKGLPYSKKKLFKTKKYDGVWVGRCEKWKRPLLFLKFVKKNEANQFLMVCSRATDKEPYFHKVKSIAQEIPNLEFLDFVKNEEIHQKFAESKIFFLTSEGEGDWPMTVLEAAINKIPIISYTLNNDYLINKYNGGVLCHGNFHFMDKIFNEFMRNPKKITEAGLNAYNYVREEHDLRKNAIKFLNIITND
jgi:glycosyltransferase involved in cell wall biosynthesis